MDRGIRLYCNFAMRRRLSIIIILISSPTLGSSIAITLLY